MAEEQKAQGDFGKKRILIYTVGSRGDCQPYCALACELIKRGHSAAVATEKRLQSLIESFNVPFFCLEGDSTGVLFQPQAQQVLLDGSFFQLMNLTKEWDAKFDKKAILDSYTKAADDFKPDVVIGAGLTLTQSFCVAEYKRVAWLTMALGPTMPTREFPVWALKSLACCNCLNRWTYSVVFKSLWGQESEFIQPWRTEKLGLKPLQLTEGLLDKIDAFKIPTIIACSPLLCGPEHERPKDYADYIKMAGFVFVPSAKEEDIDPEVRAFVNDDKSELPLVYLGFGSMPAPQPLRLLQLAADVCSQAKCRAILTAGWSDLDSDAACKALIAEQKAKGAMLVVKQVPHDWLFPKTACIVHHCGVGTMAAALRSGVPQVPCPFMLDQPHNADIMVDLGVAPSAVPYNASTHADSLAQAVNDAMAGPLAAKYRRAAMDYGKQVSDEAGEAMDVYCEAIEKWAVAERTYFDN